MRLRLGQVYVLFYPSIHTLLVHSLIKKALIINFFHGNKYSSFSASCSSSSYLHVLRLSLYYIARFVPSPLFTSSIEFSYDILSI